MNIRLWDFKIGSDKQIVPINRVPINESLLYIQKKTGKQQEFKFEFCVATLKLTLKLFFVSNSEVVIECPIIVMGADGSVISSQVITTLTQSQITTGFNVVISGTSMQYSAFVTSLSQVR